MSILTIEFLGFGAMMLAAYFILPLKIRYWALIGFSAAFVIMSGWQGGVYLLAVAALCYGGAWGLQGLRRAEEKRRGFRHLRRLLLFLLLPSWKTCLSCCF